MHGRGSVRARIVPPPPGGTTLTLEVRDEGSGVPAGQEDSVFERFRRLNAQTPGSGLGLAIVRQVTRSHGGNARFVPGEGRIVVQLPCESPAAAAGRSRLKNPLAAPMTDGSETETHDDRGQPDHV